MSTPAGGSTTFGPGGLRRPTGVAIPRDWYRPSNAYGVAGVMTIFGTLVVCLAITPMLAETGRWWAFLLLVPVLGAYVYKLTIVLHECGHRTLFTSRRANHLVGQACAGLLGVSRAGFTASHWDHHRHCGTTDETGEGDYLRLEGASPGQMAWHLLKPLSGVAYLGALRLYVRPFTAAAPAGAAPGEASATRSRLVELAWIAAMQLGVAWLATGGGRVWVGLLVYPLTAATFGLFFSRVRAFCEHVSETRAPGQCFVRSHMPNALDRLFFYTLNMNLHLEHHLFPQVPACHLWRVRALLAKAGYLEPAMTSTSILRTIVERLGAARRLHESRGSRAPAA